LSTFAKNSQLESNDEKPMEKFFANNALVLNRHGRRPPYLAVHGRLPALARRLDHAASPNYIPALRWHL